MLRLWLAAIMLLTFGTAFAQAPLPVLDPRISQQLVKVLQARIELLEAMLRAMQEDQTKHEQDLHTWFKAWMGLPAQ